MQPTIKGTFPEVIDSSIRAEYRTCPTKYYWSYVRNLGSPEPSIDLIAGGAFARGLEVVRLGFYWEKLTLPEALEKGMLAAIEFYGDAAPREGKEAKGVDRVVQALAAYFEHYNPAVDFIQPHRDATGKPMVEFTFSVPLPILHPDTGNPICYVGRFDLVGIYNGQLIGVDEKTTSQLGATWAAKWNLRGQFTGYTWALQRYGIPCVGMVARGISFLKNSFGFAESLQMRSQFEIDTWYAQLLHDVEGMKKAYTDGWYDQDFNESCAGYSGCYFQRLCKSPTPDTWISGYYVERKWNPLEKNPIEVKKTVSEVVQAPDELLALMQK